MSGAATIPEILRRVPGIDMAEMNPSDSNVSIRGFNRRIANKVLVLVDGRSVYQDFLGGTFWPLVDVAVPDIARIEVVRGPGSALYGANAFAGVVNIITRTGEEAAGVRAYAQAGNHNTFQGGVTMGGKTGKLSYRTTLTYDRADKWTRDFADERPERRGRRLRPDGGRLQGRRHAPPELRGRVSLQGRPMELPGPAAGRRPLPGESFQRLRAGPVGHEPEALAGPRVPPRPASAPGRRGHHSGRARAVGQWHAPLRAQGGPRDPPHGRDGVPRSDLPRELHRSVRPHSHPAGAGGALPGEQGANGCGSIPTTS